MRNTLFVLCVLSALLIQGCGARQLYEGLQTSQRFECHKASQSDVDECLERADISYEEYQKDRKDAQENK